MIMKKRFGNKFFLIGLMVFLMFVLNGCGGPSNGPSSAQWEILPSFSSSSSFSDFTPAGESVLYGGNLFEYVFPDNANPDGYFNFLSSAPGTIDWYTSFGWYGDYLYTAQSNEIYRYDILDDSWSTVWSGLAHSIGMAQSTADDYGYVYAVTDDGNYLLEYDTVSDNVYYISTPGLSNSEPRAAWDSLTQLVYLSDYEDTSLYAFNPSNNSFTPLASFPNSDGVSDAFCSDRRGHIFTTNGSGSGNEVWRYTASTDSWAQIQSLPFEAGSSAVCTVSADGYLYIGNGSTGEFARLKVF